MMKGRSRITTPPKFSDFGYPVGGIREGKPHTLHPLRLKPTGSADDGKRSSLNVTFVRGFPRGKTQLTPSGYPKPVGSADFLLIGAVV